MSETDYLELKMNVIHETLELYVWFWPSSVEVRRIDEGDQCSRQIRKYSYNKFSARFSSDE